MPFTKRNRILKRSTYKRARETTISLGPMCSIRTFQDLGPTLLSTLDSNIMIDGCDWRGAIAIFNYLPSCHRSITDGSDEYYFMMPEAFKNELLRENALFIILFHHVYNIFLIKEPWTTPPFRSSIKTKYEYLQRIFNSGRYNIELFLEEDLIMAQNYLKQQQYSSWKEFFNIFKESWSKEAIHNYHSDEELLSKLQTVCLNADAVLRFMKSPIDSSQDILMEVVPICEIEGLCNIILEKIDQHIIYHQTGVKPITTDWLKELDLYLFT